MRVRASVNVHVRAHAHAFVSKCMGMSMYLPLRGRQGELTGAGSLLKELRTCTMDNSMFSRFHDWRTCSMRR